MAVGVSFLNWLQLYVHCRRNKKRTAHTIIEEINKFSEQHENANTEQPPG